MLMKNTSSNPHASWARQRTRSSITSALVCFGLVVESSRVVQAADLYVDANAAAGGNGSVATPYLRITDAIGRARQLRQATVISPAERIVIHVAPGNYVGTFNSNPLDNNSNKEVLPIILNVPNLTLVGATVLDHDSRGLPTGPANAPQTKLKSGTTLTDPGQALILVTRTTDGSAGENVAINGLTLEENGSQDSPGQAGIFIDRVSGFSIAHNMFMHTGVGCLTRMSSGNFEDNCCVRNYELGAAIHGGSVNHPAVVTVRGNRCTSGFGGIDFRGTPTMRVLNNGANTLQVAPLQLVYDRNNPTDAANIPDTLDVLAILPFGYPADAIGQGKKERKPLGEVVSREHFGQPFGDA